MEEIDLIELFNFIKSKIGMIISITAIVCIIGCIYGLFIQKPMYKSYTTVILNSSDSTLTQSDLTLNKNLVDTYAEVVKSRKVLEQVIKELNLSYSYDELYGKITVSSLKNTEIIKVTVSDRDAKKAKDIANATAKYFTEIVQDLYNMNNVDVLDEAITSTTPYNINVLKQSIIYFAVGLVLSLGIVFLIYYFDRTVKSIEQVEQKIKLPILGSVQEMSEGGKKK